MPRVLLTDSIAPAGEELLAAAADVVRAPDSKPATIRRLARDADGVIIRSKLPDDIFEAAPPLLTEWWSPISPASTPSRLPNIARWRC
jgi:D-3-phosphoglycerate dehydrogenase